MLLAILLISFLCFLAIRVPVGFALGLSSMIYLVLSDRFPLQVLAHIMSAGITSFTFLAIPFFVLAGILMNRAGVTKRLFDFALCLVGRLRGGLCHVIIVAEIIVSGISGSATADAAGLSTISIGTMVEKGYPKGFSAGVVASAAVLGPIIPPSIAMVIYAVIAEVSLAKLFVAGILPGFVIALFLMGLVYFVAVKKNFPLEEKIGWADFFVSSKKALLALFAPIIILGGIVAGVFTPTEAGAAAVIYSVALGLIYREFHVRELPDILLESVLTTAVVMFIVATASVFGWILVNERVGDLLAKSLFAITQNKWVIMMIINLILLLMGCFMETVAILIIMAPIFVPITVKLGFDPIYFGVIMILNLMIGTLTPPVGVILYLTAYIAELPLTRAIKAILPFYIPLILALVVLVIFPWITTVLPEVLIK